MSIRDLLNRKLENFTQALTTLVHYKSLFEWEKALSLIQENTDSGLWKSVEEDSALVADKAMREQFEFQLKLRFHLLEVLRNVDKEDKQMTWHWQQVTDKFIEANQDVYYMELEDMKRKSRSC